MTNGTIRAGHAAILLSLTMALLPGCGGGGSESVTTPPVAGPPPSPPPPADPGTPPPPALPGTAFEDRLSTARFLTQATFGPTPADIELLTGTSASAWFVGELNKPTSLIIPEFARYAQYESLPPEAFSEFQGGVTTFAFWLHAVAGDDQLRQRVAFALSQILVVSNGGGEVLSDIPDAVASYQDVLRQHAFGNYRTLLEAVTYAPAMGFYLTYMGNQKADTATGRMPDENYAREILQLFSIGLVELNGDGTRALDPNGQPIETYNNDDITGLARVFTGLNIEPRLENGEEESIRLGWRRPMDIDERIHSDEAKTFLGTTIPAGTNARESITLALDTIFAHPNVGPFIGRQLIQRLTRSNPTPAYVGRVAAAFDAGEYDLPDGTRVGTGQRGDLAATIAAVLFDSEVRAPTALTDTQGGKIREPILRFTAWARAFNVGTVTPELTVELWNTQDSAALAQHPYRAPSVFNFFRPGFVAPGTESGAQGLTAPELQIVNASSTPGYANFMTYFATGEPRYTDPEDLRRLVEDDGLLLDPELARQSFVPDYRTELGLAERPAALVDHLADVLTYGTLRTAQRQEIASFLTQLRDAGFADDEDIVHNAVMLVLLSPDFLVQR
ncbi:MAG: DUF1800 domain-containing protein [Pseudomonadota bacterium]